MNRLVIAKIAVASPASTPTSSSALREVFYQGAGEGSSYAAVEVGGAIASDSSAIGGALSAVRAFQLTRVNDSST